MRSRTASSVRTHLPRPICAMVATVIFAVLFTSLSAHAEPVQPRISPHADSGVLISELAGAYGPGGTRDDFVELMNYGDKPVDVSGWRVYRCVGTGDRSHPPQVVLPSLVLKPGERYTIARPGTLSSIDPAVVDQNHDVSVNPHGFGIYLQDDNYGLVDRVAVYAEGSQSACGTGTNVLPNTLNDVVGESYQRVSTEGSVTTAFIPALRTPGAKNATKARTSVKSDVLISEVSYRGPTGDPEGFIELANYGDHPADLTGWQIYRCDGSNGRSGPKYHQAGPLPPTTLAPGDTFVLSGADNPAVPDPDVTYSTALASTSAGVLVLDGEYNTVDKLAMYDNKDSACADGTPAPSSLRGFAKDSFQRAQRTGDNATDFVRSVRTPGKLVEPSPIKEKPHQFSDIRVSEIVASGRAGVDDEFFEIANYGSGPVDLSGWSVWSCAGDGTRLPTPRVSDIGAVLKPKQTWVGAHQNAPASLKDVAQATYTGALNQADGYGLYLEDADGKFVDSVGVYFQDAARTPFDRFSPCTKGYSAHNVTRPGDATSQQRVQSTGTDGVDFQIEPRTPGKFNTAKVDPGTNPRPGATDSVDVPTSHRPEVSAIKQDEFANAVLSERPVTVGATDRDGDLTDVTARGAAVLDIAAEAIKVQTGITQRGPITGAPGSLAGETPAGSSEGLAVSDKRYGYPYQRFEVDVADRSHAFGVAWQGRSLGRNELQLYAWHPTDKAWTLLDSIQADEEGAVTLQGNVSMAHVVDGVVNLVVQDGPRTTPPFSDDGSESNLAFKNPGEYDFAISHFTDPQFLSESNPQVYTDAISWIVANAKSREIAYSAITGDLVQNLVFGTQDLDRARREFRRASDIQSLLEDAKIPHGVLPGNHDNMWGLDNEIYNEYFGPERYADQPWWGDSMTPEDNSFHYDTFEAAGAPFLVVHLGFTQGDKEYAWAEQVIADHPDHNIIIATHEQLGTDGERTTRDGERWTSRGEEIWEGLVEPYQNVFLVLSGHHGGVATKTSDLTVTDDVGSPGRTVVEMLANYQSFQSEPGERPNVYRDTGMQRLLQFDLASQRMAVNTYSASMDLFNAWSVDSYPYHGDDARYDDSDDEFTANVSVMYPKLVETTSLIVTEPATELPEATTTGDGKSREEGVVWAGLEPGVRYAWFVEATDAKGAVARGPISTFER